VKGRPDKSRSVPLSVIPWVCGSSPRPLKTRLWRRSKSVGPWLRSSRRSFKYCHEHGRRRDRNGILFDPLSSGSFSGSGANAITVQNKGGRNGAYGPGFAQLDLRVGWRLRRGAGRTLDLSADLINVTNRANFVNPVAAQKIRSIFLVCCC